MDELTDERYVWAAPRRVPLEKVWFPESDWETIAERRRILNEALGPCRPRNRPDPVGEVA